MTHCFVGIFEKSRGSQKVPHKFMHSKKKRVVADKRSAVFSYLQSCLVPGVPTRRDLRRRKCPMWKRLLWKHMPGQILLKEGLLMSR